jgi:choline dehydrogenase-like flavoprotein
MVLRCAVVGSGAAAASVIHAISEAHPAPDITVFERGDALKSSLETEIPGDAWSLDYFAEVYRTVRGNFGFTFPPPKSHFGLACERQLVVGWGDVWKSNMIGGLTNFWGGSALPYPAREFARWPLDRQDLDAHYRSIAARVGIAGCPDKLNSIIGDDYANRPPLQPVRVASALEAAVNNRVAVDGFRLVAGRSRLALDTRSDSLRGCVRSGQCMLGCSVGAIYSAARDIANFRNCGIIKAFVRQSVRAVDRTQREVILDSGERQKFDRIYLCAGCIETTRIAMNGVGLDDGLKMTDNTVFTFPIVFTGHSLSSSSADHYFALTNLVIAGVPDKLTEQSFVVQIFPFIDHMWRYFVPVAAWRWAQPLGRALRGRLLLGRLYLHGRYSQRYAFKRQCDGTIALILAKRPDPSATAPHGPWHLLRRALCRDGFWVPPLPPLRQATSSHYAATLPMGGDFLDGDGRLTEGIYVCDSASFPDASAFSPTFTAMANAHRIASRSLC